MWADDGDERAIFAAVDRFMESVVGGDASGPFW
jgi:hypothetical protein